jgi:hypothetical protein
VRLCKLEPSGHTQNNGGERGGLEAPEGAARGSNGKQTRVAGEMVWLERLIHQGSKL